MRGLLAPVAQMFGGDDPGLALWQFSRDTGAPLALLDLGVAKGDPDRAADLACANPYWNRRPIERAAIRHLLQAAWSGERPAGCPFCRPAL